MLWCSLFVADLIVGMEEVDLFYRCRGTKSHGKADAEADLLSEKLATISASMVRVHFAQNEGHEKDTNTVSF